MLRTVAEIYRKHATPIVVSCEDGGAGVIPGGAQQAVRWADAAGAPAPAAGLDAQRAAVLDARGAANAPRFEALRGRAASAAEFEQF